MTAVEEYSVEIIRVILSMTFTGGIISLFLFALKPIIKDKLPRSFQYYMWFSAVTAWMLPVSKFIVISVPDHSVMSMRTIYDIARWISDAASEKSVDLVFALQNENGQNIPQMTSLPSIAVILYILWQSGMILVLGFHMICYVCYVRKLGRHNKSADRKERELLNGLLERKSSLRFYKNPIVGKPILIGFFRPAVILPDKEYEDMQLHNILMHEITHWKKHDIFVKWLLILVGAIRWFDPLFYLVRREMNKACELACDESVIKRLDVSEMQQYGDTLIAVAADSVRKTPLSTAMLEDKKNLKERLGAIMKHRKYSKRTVLAACIILVTFVCVVLGISTFHHMGNEYRYSSAESRAQDPKVVNHMKEIETVKVIRNYDKENIEAAYVYLKDLDGMLSDAYIFLMCYEKRPDSEWESGVKSLVSEELGLDIQNIYVEYADF